MRQTNIVLALLALALVSVGSVIMVSTLRQSDSPEPMGSSVFLQTAPGGTFTTLVPSDAGNIAVQIVLPNAGRYIDGAPIVVLVPTFFTGEGGYNTTDHFADLGLVQVSYLRPGTKDRNGDASEGEDDFGGPLGVAALRDVLRYVSGDIADADGAFITDRTTLALRTTEVGMYAFSHPGILATKVLTTYGESLPNVRWFVGRENPTLDKISTLELGHYENDVAVKNPLYQYPESFTDTAITFDYSSVRYDAKGGVPYFDLDGNGVPTMAIDYIMGTQIPKMFGKRFYSTDLLSALRDNGVLTAATWPQDLATPELAAATWPSRSTAGTYAVLENKAPNLHVMLMFAEKDHVQPSSDKPAVHQAYSGFTDAGIWTRLNPDNVYVSWVSQNFGRITPEHPAQSEPADWSTINDWAYPPTGGSSILISKAAIAEMIDRTHENNWENDLEAILVSASSPTSSRR